MTTCFDPSWEFLLERRANKTHSYKKFKSASASRTHEPKRIVSATCAVPLSYRLRTHYRAWRRFRVTASKRACLIARAPCLPSMYRLTLSAAPTSFRHGTPPPTAPVPALVSRFHRVPAPQALGPRSLPIFPSVSAVGWRGWSEWLVWRFVVEPALEIAVLEGETWPLPPEKMRFDRSSPAVGLRCRPWTVTVSMAPAVGGAGVLWKYSAAGGDGDDSTRWSWPGFPSVPCGRPKE